MKRTTKVFGAALLALSFLAASCNQAAIDELLNGSKTEDTKTDSEDDSNNKNSETEEKENNSAEKDDTENKDDSEKKDSTSDENKDDDADKKDADSDDKKDDDADKKDTDSDDKKDDDADKKDTDSDDKKDDDADKKDADSDDKKDDDADKTDADSDDKKDDDENKDPDSAVIYTLTVENEDYDHATVTVTGEGNEKTITVKMDDGYTFAALAINDAFITNDDVIIKSDLMCTTATYNAILESDTKVNVYRVITDAQKYGTNELFTAAADGTLYLCNAVISGVRGTNKEGKKTNPFISYSAANVVISNVIVMGTNSDNKIYNVFEQSGEQTPIESLTVTNLTVDGTNITHNFINAYTFAENAVVTVKDSNFDIHNDNDISRFSNRTTAKNITINFENINWKYDETKVTDTTWTSIVIYQPWNRDKIADEITATKTWTFNYTDCLYNGVKVTSNVYPSYSALLYAYHFEADKGNTCSALDATINVK